VLSHRIKSPLWQPRRLHRRHRHASWQP
jgi:hypothetical protein